MKVEDEVRTWNESEAEKKGRKVARFDILTDDSYDYYMGLIYYRI